MRIIFLDNGNTAVFNDNGEQIPDLQKSWILLFVEFLESSGFDPCKANFYKHMGREIRIIKTSAGYSWELVVSK